MKLLKYKDPCAWCIGVGYYANARIRYAYDLEWAFLFFIGHWAIGIGRPLGALYPTAMASDAGTRKSKGSSGK